MQKIFYYFSLSPRLQRLYSLKEIASHMTWHTEHHTEDGEMIHPFGAQAWLTVNDVHQEFALETRNL